MKYTFKTCKWGVSVYKNNNICAMIDEDFAIKYGYKTALEYCKKVFL